MKEITISQNSCMRSPDAHESRSIYNVLKQLSAPSPTIIFYSASAWPMCTLMVKKFNIYPERADEHYAVLTDMSVHHVMTSTAVNNMLYLLTIYITARHFSKMSFLVVKVKLYRHACWEESEHVQVHWLEVCWLTEQKQGFASQPEVGFESSRSALFASFHWVQSLKAGYFTLLWIKAPANWQTN